MPSGAGGSIEEVFYKQLHYRSVRPLEHQLECLDVLTRVDESLLHRVALKMPRTKLTPLVKIGSMLTDDLMAEDSKWRRSPEGKAERLRIGKAKAQLKNALVQRLPSAEFQKELLPKVSVGWKNSKGAVAWLCGITGVDLGGEESLSCTLDGLTAASVDFTKVRSWISAGDWRPDATTFKLMSVDWSKESGTKKLWIVTDVLYAKKCTVEGSNGYSHKVMAKYTITGVPGVGVDVGAEIGIHKIDESSVELRAKKNKQFIVGYRTMRVDYKPDGTLQALKAPGDTGVRAGDDDDPLQTILISMEEDIFEVAEDGDEVPIPLLTPTEQEVQALRSVVADSKEEGSSST